MSLNMRHRFLATSVMLMARKKAAVAKHRANGCSENLAQSLVRKMEKPARLARKVRPAAAGNRSCSTNAREVLESSFLCSVARELKNHLQCLMLDLDFAQRSPQGSVANTSALREIEGVLTMMNLLSDDLAIAADMPDGEPNWSIRSHSVARLLEKVVDGLVPVARLAEVVLHIAPIAQPLEVRCNWDRTLHAMTHFAMEVLKATRCGGRVTFAARRSRGMVRFSLTTDAAHVAEGARASVSQTRSFRARLAPTLIEAQRGRVWSCRVLGRGNRTYVEIPRA